MEELRIMQIEEWQAFDLGYLINDDLNYGWLELDGAVLSIAKILELILDDTPLQVSEIGEATLHYNHIVNPSAIVMYCGDYAINMNKARIK